MGMASRCRLPLVGRALEPRPPVCRRQPARWHTALTPALACRSTSASRMHLVQAHGPITARLPARRPSTSDCRPQHLPPRTHLARAQSANTRPSTVTSARHVSHRVQVHTLAVVRRRPRPHSDATPEGRLAVHRGRVGHLDFLHGMDGRVIWTL